MQFPIKFLYFLLIHQYTNSLFSNPLKKLKENAKKYFKNKIEKERLHFLGHDLSEYPGTHEHYRQINREKWDEYYACLSIQEHAGMTPEAVQTLETQSIKLDCRICLSPTEETNIESVEWLWSAPKGKHLKQLEFTEHILLSPETKRLEIYNLHAGNTGQYLCKLGETESAPYFLTVLNGSDDNVREVHPRDAPQGPYSKETEFIGTIIINTRWLEWSPCTKCGSIGRKYRPGYCIVTFNNQSEVGGELDADLELLKIFKNGIPCESHILPRSIKQLPQVQERKNEIMSGYCHEKCPDEEIFEVRDKDGNVIERANNSAGIYSMLQGLPGPQPPIERSLEFLAAGKPAILSCPGNLNSEIPVLWQIGAKKLIPELIIKQTNGRIFISITDRIHIKNAKLLDSNIYSCWQHGNLAGTIRLIVEQQFSLDIMQHIKLFGLVLICATFLYVFIRVLMGRKHVVK